MLFAYQLVPFDEKKEPVSILAFGAIVLVTVSDGKPSVEALEVLESFITTEKYSPSVNAAGLSRTTV